MSRTFWSVVQINLQYFSQTRLPYWRPKWKMNKCVLCSVDIWQYIFPESLQLTLCEFFNYREERSSSHLSWFEESSIKEHSNFLTPNARLIFSLSFGTSMIYCIPTKNCQYSSSSASEARTTPIGFSCLKNGRIFSDKYLSPPSWDITLKISWLTPSVRGAHFNSTEEDRDDFSSPRLMTSFSNWLNENETCRTGELVSSLKPDI